ncbi:NifU family protein [Cryptosporangium sp. NPDC051539]|uniref:NifU family protein n=1 Tax=Cryptosporangium sp. NPDC051539 TaxID=3363962 RepID=UPI00379BB18B
MTDHTSAKDRAPAEDRPLEELASALDRATDAVRSLDAGPRRAADDLEAALSDAHRAALVRIVRVLRADPRGKELLFELVDDPAVRMVLLMHGIVRPDPETLARAALESVQPGIRSHGGDVSLVRVAEGTAFVRLSGACNGCSMAAVTLRDGVEKALLAGVPGLRAVEVVPNEPAPALVPLTEIGLRPGAVPAGSGWTPPDPAWCRVSGDFAPGAIVPVTLEPAGGDPVDAIVVNSSGQLTAFVNRCAHLAMPLEDAELSDGVLTCPWHGYCFDASDGECASLPGLRLEQLPLRVDGGNVWVRARS